MLRQPVCFALFVLTVVCALVPSRSANAIELTVRGEGVIRLIATRDDRLPTELTIRGALEDDSGAAMPKQQILLDVRATKDGDRMPLPSPRNCGRGTSQAQLQNDRVRIETDEQGGFCIALSDPKQEAQWVHAKTSFSRSEFFDQSETTIGIESASAQALQTELKFEPSFSTVDLDQESFSATATLGISRAESQRVPGTLIRAKRSDLAVKLSDENGKLLATARTSGDGKARFQLKPSAMGPPGEGELRLTFDGTDELLRATEIQTIDRVAEVTLTLVEPPAAGDANSGIAMVVEALTAHGPARDGVIEATRDGSPVGVGNVKDGRAELVVRFEANKAGEVPISIQYVSSAKHYRAGPPLRVRVPVTGPSLWSRIVLGILVAALAFWVVVRWRRAPKPALPVEKASVAPLSGRPGVHVVATTSQTDGWSGIVSDAHDGTAIVGARLQVRIPTFDGDGIVGECVSDADGKFQIRSSSQDHAQLLVEAEMHAAHEQALPPPSVISVALVTRRRALTDRLVRWSRKMGAPFDGPPEPTPGHVRRVASWSRLDDVAKWARAVEHAVFGSAPVDASLEKDVRAQEPRRGDGQA